MKSKSKFEKIKIQDFINSFGAKKNEFDKKIIKYIKKSNFEYTKICGKKKLDLIKQINSQLIKKKISKSGKKRFKEWNKGWRENYIDFIKSDYNSKKLIPKYIHGDRPVRWKQNFILPKKNLLEWRFSTVFRSWLFSKYFEKVDEVYDFGTGTACHLELLSKIYPKKKLTGLDWSKYSVKIIDLLRKKKNLNIYGKEFNFFKVNNSIKLPKNTGVLTFAALEQVSKTYKNFINYLLKNKPTICVHVECMENMYNKKNKIDHLGYKYHMQRAYLQNFIPYLLKLSKEKKLKIIKIKRLFFGSYYHEVYNYVVWKPLI